MMPKQLKVVDETLATYLKISSEERRFVYYTFETNQAEHWDILGIYYLRKNPLLIDVRLMYIDQDARDWEQFVAERDAPGYITFNFVTYLNMITFFEMLLNGEVQDQDKTTKSFFVLDREELLQLHYSSDAIDAAVDTYYRYIPNTEDVQDPDMINIVRLPHWSTHDRMQQISSLWFINLSQKHLRDTKFDLESDIDGSNTLRFNKSALEEFVLLLKEKIKVNF